MTTATARIPRRLMRKCLKSVCLWINEILTDRSEWEVERLRFVRADSISAEVRENARQIRLRLQRRRMEEW